VWKLWIIHFCWYIFSLYLITILAIWIVLNGIQLVMVYIYLNRLSANPHLLFTPASKWIKQRQLILENKFHVFTCILHLTTLILPSRFHMFTCILHLTTLILPSRFHMFTCILHLTTLILPSRLCVLVRLQPRFTYFCFFVYLAKEGLLSILNWCFTTPAI
jgi:hypothetical protein